jgi:beta-hydroxylase
MHFLESPKAQSLVENVNEWIKRHSADPLEPFLPGVLHRPSLQDFMKHFSVIKKEILDHRDVATRIQGDLFFGSEITRDGKWKRIYIKWYAPIKEKAWTLFPRTCALLDHHRDIHLAMVSVLEPGGTIYPHRGSWAGSIRVHIGLQTPNDPRCYISINGQNYWWTDGGIVAFDDTYDHFVVNSTLKSRIILFLDIERKMKTPFKQFVVNFLNRTLGRLTTRE